MQQIINFILRNKNFLLYMALLTVSLLFTVRSHSYHQSRFFNSANWLSGNLYSTSHDVGSYFGLVEENRKLVEENKRLRKLLFNRANNDSLPIDSLQAPYTVTTARVIKNSYSRPRNYLTIDKGELDGVKVDMGVIGPKGILGIVENTSKHFATVQSILNQESNINAKILHSQHFGSLIWDTRHYNTVQLTDIPRLVKLTVGDTIVTGAMSSIFPEDIPIGTIKSYNLDDSRSFYTIDVALFNDMTDLRNVYLVENVQKEEIDELQKETESDDY